MVKSLSFNVLCRSGLKTSIVKKYYSAVYTPKVADLYSQKHPLITLKPCFYSSKSMFVASLSILISKRMLIIQRFRAMQLTSVIFLFSRLKKYFVLSFYLKQELLIKGNPKNLRLGTKRSNRTIVLSDMLSDSIKYKNQRSAKLICDPKLLPNNLNRKQSD